MRRSDSLPPFPPASVSFGWQYPSRCACLRFSRLARRRPRGLELWVRPPLPLLSRWSRRISQVPGEPSCAYALFSDPGGTGVPGLIQYADTAPASSNNEGFPREHTFGAQSHGFDTGCLRFARRVAPQATQDSLPAAGQALPGGIRYPQGSYERFPQYHPYILPPFPSFRAQWQQMRSEFGPAHLAAASLR